MRCTIRARCRSLKWTGCSVSHVYAARGWCALNCRSIRHNNVLIKAGARAAAGCYILRPPFPRLVEPSAAGSVRNGSRQPPKPPHQSKMLRDERSGWNEAMKRGVAHMTNSVAAHAHCALAVSGLVRRAHWLLYVVTWHISRLDGSIRTRWFALPRIVLLALTIYLDTFYSVRVNY